MNNFDDHGHLIANKIIVEEPLMQSERLELDKLRAENARLKSVIDEANSQPAFAHYWITNQYGGEPVINFEEGGAFIGDIGMGKFATNLFERPLPAQQSYDQALQLLAESRENYEKQFGFSSDADWVYKDLAELFIVDLPAQQSPAVTNACAECGADDPCLALYCVSCISSMGGALSETSPAVAVPDRMLKAIRASMCESSCDIEGSSDKCCMPDIRELYQMLSNFQSPAVAVPDYKEELFQIRQQAENWSAKLGFIISVINSRKISLSDKEREFPHLLIERLHTDSELLKQRSVSTRITEQYLREIIESTNGFTSTETMDVDFEHWLKEVGNRFVGVSQRVTEQDTREIATQFFYWWHNQPGTNTMQGFDEWIADDGRALLTKLNEVDHAR